MKHLGLIAISCICLVASEARSAPAAPDHCAVFDVQSAESPEIARKFIAKEGGGILRLCWNKANPRVAVNYFASNVEKLANGICRYFISQVHEVRSSEGPQLSFAREVTGEVSERYYYQNLVDGEECPEPGNRMRDVSHITYVLEDAAYIQVEQIDDEIFTSFLSFWRQLMASSMHFESMLPERSVLLLKERRDENLWLINGCVSAAPRGCRVALRKLEASQWANATMVRARFQITGFDQIAGVYGGRARYSTQQKRYEGMINFWQSEKGYEPAH